MRRSPAKFEKAALRGHARYVTEAQPSLLKAQISLAALVEIAKAATRSRAHDPREDIDLGRN